MLKIVSRLACVLALSLTLAACSNQSAPSAQVAVVDLAEVQNTSTVVTEVAAYLDSLRGKLMAEALEAEQAFKENENDETRQAYLDAVDNFEQAVGAEEQRIFTTLSENIDRILSEYREQQGITAILLKDTVLSFDPKLDITKDVTAELDKVELDLTPPAKPEPAAEAAPEAAPEAEAKPSE